MNESTSHLWQPFPPRRLHKRTNSYIEAGRICRMDGRVPRHKVNFSSLIAAWIANAEAGTAFSIPYLLLLMRKDFLRPLPPASCAISVGSTIGHGAVGI
jgi:hypothetical protein